MSCRRRRGYRRFSTSAYRLLGDFEVAINGGVWVATGAGADFIKSFTNEEDMRETAQSIHSASDHLKNIVDQ